MENYREEVQERLGLRQKYQATKLKKVHSKITKLLPGITNYRGLHAMLLQASQHTICIRRRTHTDSGRNLRNNYAIHLRDGENWDVPIYTKSTTPASQPTALATRRAVAPAVEQAARAVPSAGSPDERYLPPRGQRRGNGQNVRRHILDRLHASMIKQKKNQTNGTNGDWFSVFLWAAAQRARDSLSASISARSAPKGTTLPAVGKYLASTGASTQSYHFFLADYRR